MKMTGETHVDEDVSSWAISLPVARGPLLFPAAMGNVSIGFIKVPILF